MNHIFRVLAVLGVLLVGIAWSAMGPNPATPEIVIVSAEFGLFNSPQSGKPPFVPSTVVPFQEGQAYGWIIQIKTTEPNVKWREEFTLPATPQTWAVRPGNHTVSPDRKTSVIEREVKPQGSIIYNVWTVVPGDPKGRYVIRVTVEGSAERTFEFDVR